MYTSFSSLEHDTVTNKIIADYIRIAKSKDMMASLGMTNLVKEVLPPRMVNGVRF